MASGEFHRNGQNYHDDDEDELEELSDKLDDEEEHEEIEEIDSDDETAGMSLEEKQEFEVEEIEATQRLKSIIGKLPNRFLPILYPREKSWMRKARRHKNLRPLVNGVNKILKPKKEEFKAKMFNWIIQFISVAWPFLLILLVIIVCIGVAGALMPWLFDDEDNPNGTATSVYGITGDDFYGLRTIYRDKVRARGELTREYMLLIEDSLDDALETYSANITIVENALPNSEYYDDIDLEAFTTNYPVASEYIGKVASLIYEIDNGTIASGLGLGDTLDGIEYFGFDSSALNDIKSLVKEYIDNFYTFNANGSATESEVDTSIDSIVDNNIDNMNVVRTEKLFVEDYILTGDDSRVTDLIRRDYVAHIFMPRVDVKYKSMSFFAVYVDEGFDMELICGGVDMGINKTAIDKNGSITQYTYEVDNLNQNVDTYDYTSIDNISLYDIMNDSTLSSYLVANDEGIMTWRDELGMVLSFTNPNEEEFIAIEYETKWERD